MATTPAARVTSSVGPGSGVQLAGPGRTAACAPDKPRVRAPPHALRGAARGPNLPTKPAPNPAGIRGSAGAARPLAAHVPRPHKARRHAPQAFAGPTLLAPSARASRRLRPARPPLYGIRGPAPPY